MITRTVVRSGGGGGSGSSLPGSVDYAYIVAKAKVGLNDAITEPTSWSFKVAMGTASADVSTDTQLNGCVYMRAGGILVAKYSDGSDACTYTVSGGWLDTDELIIVLYTDGYLIQLGIVRSGAYSWGAHQQVTYPYEISGFDYGLLGLVFEMTDTQQRSSMADAIGATFSIAEINAEQLYINDTLAYVQN